MHLEQIPENLHLMKVLMSEKLKYTYVIMDIVYMDMIIVPFLSSTVEEYKFGDYISNLKFLKSLKEFFYN